mgnify:FL=1
MKKEIKRTTRYGKEIKKEEGSPGKKFWIFVAKKSAAQNITTAKMVLRLFFFPTKTAAKAIQPLPLEILGTKAQSLSTRSEPARLA